VGIAWVAALLVLVGAVLGLGVAYALEGIVAPDTTAGDRSILADLLGWAVLCLLTLLPAVVAWRLGATAEAEGDRRGRAPRLVAATLAVVVVVGLMVQLAVNAAQGQY
jgi:hypothetical protein